MVLSFTAEIFLLTFAVEAIVSISTISARRSSWREFAYLLLILSFILIDPSDALAITSKNKAIKNVAVKNAKRSNPTSVINTLLNGVGAPSSKVGVNGDFYIDTVSMNIYGPKKKNAWPLPKSLVGPQGVAGAPGKQGSNGKDGRDGINGKDGERGPAGSSSTSSGATGPAGPVGPIGPSGPAGATGPAGPAGPAGAQGVAGPQGAQGLVGAAGTAGAAGAQGEAGPRGLQGLQGETGATGPAGIAGTAGAQGDTGPRGIQGIQGVQGETGLTGPAGPVNILFGAVNFVGNLSGSSLTTKNSSNFGSLQTGKKYLLRAEVFASSSVGGSYFLSGAVSVTGAAITPDTKFATGGGYSYRAPSSRIENRVSIVSTIDGSLISGANYELYIAITCADSTTGSNQLTLSGFYTLEEVTSIN